jgi:hypothetical protein
MVFQTFLVKIEKSLRPLLASCALPITEKSKLIFVSTARPPHVEKELRSKHFRVRLNVGFYEDEVRFWTCEKYVHLGVCNRDEVNQGSRTGTCGWNKKFTLIAEIVNLTITHIHKKKSGSLLLLN